MTSREFYKKTSDMAYPVEISETIDDEDVVVGKIAFTCKTRDDAEKFLKENNFFAVDCNTDNIDLDEVSLVLEFHYDLGRFDAFMLNVCDVIDCREAGGKLVLSCTDEHELIKEVFLKVDEEGNDEDGDKCDKCDKCCKKEPAYDIFDAFDDIISTPKFSFSTLFPSIPSLFDFGKVVENTKNTIDNIKKGLLKDKDGNSRFYEISCKIGPDGKVSFKKSTNDGTVEKTFMLGDDKSADKKIENKDGDKVSDSVKKLKDII